MRETSGFTELPSDATAAGQARSRVHRTCGTALNERRLYEAELLVSELVTNALRYGQAPVALAVDCTDHLVLVRVRNRGAGRPRVIDPDPTDEHGRGLLLLDVMSDKWGVQGDRAETVVWFTVGRSNGGSRQVG